MISQISISAKVLVTLALLGLGTVLLLVSSGHNQLLPTYVTNTFRSNDFQSVDREIAAQDTLGENLIYKNPPDLLDYDSPGKHAVEDNLVNRAVDEDNLLDSDPPDDDDELSSSEPDDIKSESIDHSSNLYFNQAENAESSNTTRQPTIHLITFATPSYVKYANALFRSAASKASCPVNKTILSMDDIDETFKTKNKRTFNVRKGAGYWLWKPYIIRKKLGEIPDGDFLMYTDSKYLFMTDLCGLLPQKTDHVCLNRKAGEGQYRELPYTKRDAYILMDVHPDPRRIQPWAGFLIFRKTAENIQFVDEWLKYSEDFRIISNNPSVLGSELPGFRANRNDQTVLSLLLRKWKWQCRDLPRFVLFNIRSKRTI